MANGIEVIGEFNSESREDVKLIKEKAAELIDLIQKYGVSDRRKAIAITNIEQGTMMGIKSIFSKI